VRVGLLSLWPASVARVPNADLERLASLVESSGPATPMRISGRRRSVWGPVMYNKRRRHPRPWKRLHGASQGGLHFRSSKLELRAGGEGELSSRKPGRKTKIVGGGGAGRSFI